MDLRKRIENKCGYILAIAARNWKSSDGKAYVAPPFAGVKHLTADQLAAEEKAMEGSYSQQKRNNNAREEEEAEEAAVKEAETNEEAARLARLEEEAADLLPDYWDNDGEEGGAEGACDTELVWGGGKEDVKDGPEGGGNNVD